MVTGSPIVLSEQEDTGRDRPSDAELSARVRAALVDDEATKARQISVSIRNGVVQLSGFVDSEEMKEAALTTARSVRGVSEVRNGLIVRQGDRDVGAAVDDGVIAAKVRTQLDSEVDLGAANDIDLLVNNGIVHLSGVVSSIEEKNRAADVASNVDGVKDVRNDIALEETFWRR